QIACSSPADRCLNRAVDIARRQTVSGAADAIDLDCYRRLAKRIQHRQVGYSCYGTEDLFDLGGGFFERRKFIAEQLDRVLAFDTGRGFLDVILDILREVELDAGKLRLKRGTELLRQYLLIDAGGPAVGWCQRCKKLSIEKARRVCAIVRPAILRHDRD